MKNFITTALVLTATPIFALSSLQELTTLKKELEQEPISIPHEPCNNAYNTLIFNVDQRQNTEVKNDLSAKQVTEIPAPLPQKKSGNIKKVAVIILSGVVGAGGIALTVMTALLENSLYGMTYT